MEIKRNKLKRKGTNSKSIPSYFKIFGYPSFSYLFIASSNLLSYSVHFTLKDEGNITHILGKIEEIREVLFPSIFV